MRKATIWARPSRFVPNRRAAALLLAAAAVPLPAAAIPRTYSGATGLWSNTLNWNPSGVPVAGDAVTLQPGANPTVTVTYDTSVGTNNSFLSLNINSTNSNAINLLQTSGSFSTSNGEIIGDTGTGSFALQSGTHALGNGTMFIGNAASGNGTVTITGGSLAGVEIDAGFNGNGTLIQNGGSIVASVVSVGRLATSHGSYSFTAGSLSLSGALLVGESGSGTMNQSGGTAILAGLHVGFAAGAVGTYSLSNNATLNVNGSFFVGNGGSGTFNQAGGNVSSTSGILLGNSTGTGTVNLSGGTQSTASLTINRASTFTQSGGTLSVTGTNGVSIGNSASVASYNENAGVATIAGSEYVGFSGNGSFNLSGGTHTVNAFGTNGLFFGYNPGSSGSGSLSGTGVLNVPAGTEAIGYAGSGSFSQSGGTHSVNALIIGYNSGTNTGSGVYTQSGGVLNEIGSAQLVGYGGNGIFNQSGGTNNSLDLYLGLSTAASGIYSLSNSASLKVNGNFTVGFSGSGTFNQTGGNATVTGFLDLADQAGAAGTANLSGGSLTVGYESVGFFGKGIFNQSGGTHTSLDYITVGDQPLGNGVYSLTGGTLSIPAGDLNVAWLGHGTFNHSGGTALIHELVVAHEVGSVGVYSMSSAATLSVDSNVFVGYSGSGTFNQSGGTVAIASSEIIGLNSTGSLTLSGGTHTVSGVFPDGLFIGKEIGSSGTVTLTGNAILNVATVNGEEFVGYTGSGAFNQSGGSNNVQTLTMGWNAAGGNVGHGVYTQTGGTLNVTSGEYVGFQGNGIVNQSGGSNTAANLYVGFFANAAGAAFNGVYAMSNGASLRVINEFFFGVNTSGKFVQTGGNVTALAGLVFGANPGSTGVANVSGGTLSVTLSETVGQSGNAIFNQSGGTHTAGNLTIATNPGSTGTYNLGGGTLAAPVLNNGSFNQTGGTYNGTFTNTPSGVFNYTNGTFTGRLIHYGTLNFGPNLTLGNGLQNETTIALVSGQTLTLNGAGLANNGQISLAGATVNGSGALANNGQVSGFGTLGGSGGFANNNLFAQSGGNVVLSNSGPNSNNANMMLAPGWQLQLAGSGLSNYSAFNLNGALVNGIGGLTNTAGGTISGPGTITTPFSNAGTLLVQNGAMNITQPFITSGYVQLAAANASLTGGAITNTGKIQGIGALANSLNNTGTVEPIGGTLAISGAVTNVAPGLFRVSSGNQLLMTSGLSANGGAISLTGGTFDNNGHVLNNNGSITGYGTLATGGLTNASGATMTFGGGAAAGITTINGPVTNNSGGTIRSALSPLMFTGNLVNNGNLKVTGTPTNTVTIAGNYSGSGTYFSDPADNHFLGNVTVDPGGQMLGSVGDRFFMSGTYANSGTYLNSGGTLSAQDVINAGQLNQTAGQATIANLSGPGSTTVGGAGTSLVSVASFAQANINIQTGGTLFARSAATPHAVTDTVGSLAIATTGSAILDLNNHDLLIDSACTSFANVQSYWRSGYNMHPYNAGFDDEGAGYYDGTHGLISTVAKADPSFKHQVGYIDGNAQNIYGFTMADIGGPDLATNRILVRPVLMGDVNFDGKVDPSDIQVLLGTNKFGKGPGTATDGWIDGDFNGDGVADPTDIQLLLAANTFNSGQTYGAAATASPKTLTGKSSAVITVSTTSGGHGDNKFDYVYDPATGDVKISYDGDPNITAANTLQHMKLASSGSKFIVGNVNNSGVAPSFSSESASLLDMVQNDNTKPIQDNYDLGNVLPQGLGLSDLLTDLTLQFGVLNQFSLKSAEVLVPEPTTLGLIGIGAVGLLASRRRRNHTNMASGAPH